MGPNKKVHSNEKKENKEDKIKIIDKRKIMYKSQILEHLEEGRHLMKRFLDGHVEEVLSILEEKSKDSLVHLHGIGAVKFFDSVLKFDTDMKKEAFKEANEVLKLANIRVDAYRRKSYTNLIFTPDYNNYSDLECIAELLCSISLILWGITTVLSDQSIVNLINGGLRMRSSYIGFKECLSILRNRRIWESEKCRIHFESGTRLGIGGFNLFVSFLPAKLTRILEFIGFSSDSEIGIRELTKSVENEDGFLNDIAYVFLSVYYGFLEYFYGIGEGGQQFFNKPSIKSWISNLETLGFSNLGKGVISLMNGNIDEAIEEFNLSIKYQKDWKQMNYAAYWLACWCNAINCNWKEAANCAKILKNECKWSPTLFHYLYACFTFMRTNNETQPELKEEVIQVLSEIPKLKKILLGNGVFHERMVLSRSRKYHKNIDEVLFPQFELMYIWNFFNILSCRPDILNNYLQMIEEKLILFSRDEADDKNAYLDKYAFMVFLKGVCYRHLGEIQTALLCFDEVLNCKNNINEEIHLLPQTCFEIGCIYYKSGNTEKAKKWLKKARDDYNGYMTEVMIQYRIRVVLKAIRSQETKSK